MTPTLQERIMALIDDDVKISEARSICRAVTELERQAIAHSEVADDRD